jgi:serine/threonine protein kinase
VRFVMNEGQPQPPLEDRDGEDLGGHVPGDVVAGKYQLLRVIGSGGMGTVWAATNLDLDLEVALKLVNRGLDSEETRARLATEARAEARVQHRGIVRVLDLGVTDQGEPFLVMERLAGRTLGELLDECRYLEPVDAVRIMLPVLEALAAVHERGVVHRDLKPDNILLSEHGGRIQPKIVDFGIAKLESAPTPRRTGRGAVVGSPGYMAPEHARGVDVDHRADIFTASVVLYESITGQSAFQGSNYNALLRAVIERKLDPITSFGRGDAALWRILERGLRKDPARRYSSCLEFGRALATWLLSQGESEDVTGHALSHWWEDDAGAPLRNTHRSTPADRALAIRTPSRSRRTGRPPGSMHGVSFSTSRGAAPGRLPRRRLAVLALASAGFLGGFAATSDFFPWHSPGPDPQPAAASTPAAKPAPVAVEPSDGPEVTTVSVAAQQPTRPVPTAASARSGAKPTIPERAAEPPPSRAPAPQKRQSFTLADLPDPPPNPFDRPEDPPPPREPPRSALTLPPDPPPPGALLRQSTVEAELKDPYQ